jgi:hypothetical protein
MTKEVVSSVKVHRNERVGDVDELDDNYERVVEVVSAASLTAAEGNGR